MNINEKLGIDELLSALKNPNNLDEEGSVSKLPNNADTWSRLGSGDQFKELGLEGSELEEFLKEWVAENPYSAL